MPVHLLLDTNTASYVIKGNIPLVRQRLVKAPVGQTVISVITEAELRFGVARLPHSVRLALAVDEFLLRVEILPWDSAAAQKYAGLRAIFETIGEPMGNLDLMIAAQALAIDAILVSNDRVFRRIKGLRMEDWSKP